MRGFGFAIGVGLLAFGASVANAGEGRIVGRADLLAGPAKNFPNVRILPDGTEVQVHGCLQNRQWCDVTWRGKRGWVDSMNVAYAGGPLPVVAFNCNQYWDQHYKSQFFYPDKDKWRGLADRQRLTQTIGISSAE